MGRSKAREREFFDAELADLPQAARWREWMLRVEAAIFASLTPTPRENLARLVGKDCRLDDLVDDLKTELHGRPYDLVFVAGGFQLRTKPRFATATPRARLPAETSRRNSRPSPQRSSPATTSSWRLIATARVN